MLAVNDGQLDLVRAIFCEEFAPDGVGESTMRALVHLDVDSWIAALDRTGLFTGSELLRLTSLWRERPQELIAILLEGADELTLRRAGAALASREPVRVAAV